MANGYKDIAAYLREQIEDGSFAPGGQLPSHAELVEKFGVSTKTVKMAIKELVHGGYVYSRQGKGAFVAEQAPQRGRVLFLMPHLAADDVFHEIYVECERAFVGRLQAVYAGTENDYRHVKKQLKSMAPGSYEAIVFVPLTGKDVGRNVALVDALRGKAKHLILLDRGVLGLSLPLVRFDNRAASQKLGAFLKRGRYDSYVFVYAAKTETVDQRLRGFEEAVGPGGEVVSRQLAGRVDEGFDEIAAQVGRGETLGVFAVNEQLAHRLLLRLQKEGIRVPEQVGIVTFGNSLDLGYRMTTAAPDTGLIASVLLDMIRSGKPVGITIKSKIIRGESTPARR